jgi:predicted RNA binding protein YcfA (HicA-like mRNA interferase family)
LRSHTRLSGAQRRNRSPGENRREEGALVIGWILVKVREVIRLLQADGWALVTIDGSHRQFKHPTKAGRVTVAGALNDDMPKGTFGSVKRQAGLKVRKS